MPSNTQRIATAIASIGITVGGAYLASSLGTAANNWRASEMLGTPLKVTIQGVRNDKGSVVVMVFDDRSAYQAYDVTNAAGYRELPAEVGQVSVEFPTLVSGPYVAAAFHDEDGNLDLTMSGEIPLEGYATSGALDAYHMPTFTEALMAGGEVKLQLYYVGTN